MKTSFSSSEQNRPDRHAWILQAGTLLLCLGFYLPALRRGPSSEDFTIIRHLSGQGWETNLIENLTGPWLDLGFVHFYRPLSTVIFDAALGISGTSSSPLIAFHLGWHAFNVWLIFAITRRLTSDIAASAVAMVVFAFYPWHPNAVVFLASFATLYSATFCLAAVWFLISRRHPTPIDRLRVLILYVAALLSYEAAVCLPVVLLALEKSRQPSRPWRSLLLSHAGFIATTLAYLATRTLLLDLPSSTGIPMPDSLSTAARWLWTDWARMVAPSVSSHLWDKRHVFALLTLLGLMIWVFRSRGARRPAVRLAAVGVIWALAMQWPFQRLSVGAVEGRYWYLSTVGIALLGAATVLAFRGARRTIVASVLISATLVVYLPALARNIEIHRRAGEEAERVRDGVMALDRSPVFLINHPRQITTTDAAALVFLWGVADAFLPPFLPQAQAREVYPLPRAPKTRFAVLNGLGTVWDHSTQEVVTFEQTSIASRIPSTLDDRTKPTSLHFRALPNRRYLLNVIAMGHPVRKRVHGIADADGWLEAPLPVAFLDYNLRTFRGPIWIWIEDERDPSRVSEVWQVDPLPPTIQREHSVTDLPSPGPSDDHDAVLRSEKARSPNILLVLSDTHRADHVFTDPETQADSTPNLGKLISRGITFSDVLAVSPISAPSYASLMTGVRPREHGVLNNAQTLDTELPVLGEKLRELGYTTSGIVSNPFCSERFGFSRGFDTFWDDVDGRGQWGRHVTDAAISWLNERPIDRPFFLFTAYMDGHKPYFYDDTPPSLAISVNGREMARTAAENRYVLNRIPIQLRPGGNDIELRFLEDGEVAFPSTAMSPLLLAEMALGRPELTITLGSGLDPVNHSTPHVRLRNRGQLRVHNPAPTSIATELVFRCHREYSTSEMPRRYRLGVASFDTHLGRLLDHLSEKGLLEDTLIVVMSDHGEMLGEHQAWGHVDHLYPETLQIPLVVAGGSFGRGTRSEALSLVDVHDLVLLLAEGGGLATFPPRHGDDPRIAATFPPEARELLVSVQDSRYRLLSNGQDRWDLFERMEGPDEKMDLSSELAANPQIRALVDHLRRNLEELRELESLDPGTLSPRMIGEIETLGYL